MGTPVKPLESAVNETGRDYLDRKRELELKEREVAAKERQAATKEITLGRSPSFR